jgi:hypothetical protein
MTVWSVLLTVAGVALLVWAALWVVQWGKGRRTLRDPRGRLKPGPALAIAIGVLIAAGLALDLATR